MLPGHQRPPLCCQVEDGVLALCCLLGEQVTANAHAIAYLIQEWELFHLLPDTPERTRWELEYRLTLGVPQVLTLGHAAVEVKTNYERTRELSPQAGDACIGCPKPCGRGNRFNSAWFV